MLVAIDPQTFDALSPETLARKAIQPTIKAMRGKDAAAKLEIFAQLTVGKDHFCCSGCSTAIPTVASTNIRSLALLAKSGYKLAGP